MRARQQNQSSWTLYNSSKDYRQFEKVNQESRTRSHVASCHIIALGSKKGSLATADNRMMVYPELRDKKPHGQCDVQLISGTFQSPPSSLETQSRAP